MLLSLAALPDLLLVDATSAVLSAPVVGSWEWPGPVAHQLHWVLVVRAMDLEMFVRSSTKSSLSVPVVAGIVLSMILRPSFPLTMSNHSSGESVWSVHPRRSWES